MSEVSIFNLIALGAAPATGDLLAVVDVSNPAQSPHGSLLKMTVGNLFTSPTLTGTTTVSTLVALVTVTSVEVDVTTLLATKSTTPVVITNSSAGPGGGFISMVRGVVQSGFLLADATDSLAIGRGDGLAAFTVERITGIAIATYDLNVNTATTQTLQMGSATTIQRTGATGALAVTTSSNGNITLDPGGSGKIVLQGNVTVGTMTPLSNAATQIFIANDNAPTGTPSGGGVLWCEAGALKYRGQSGTTTTLAAA